MFKGLNLILFTLLMGCGASFNLALNLQDSFKKGTKSSGSRTYSNVQKNILEQADVEFHKPITITKEMVTSYKEGQSKVEKYLAQRGDKFYRTDDLLGLDPELMKRNPKLETCSSDIIKIANLTWKILAPAKFVVVECHRSKERQLALKKKGNSQVVDSWHNKFPSMAMDTAPLYKGKIPWKDHKQFSFISGIRHSVCLMLERAGEINCKCRAGDNWKGINVVGRETTLYDPGHVECKKKKKMSLTYRYR